MPVRDTTISQLALELREALGRVGRRLRAERGPSAGRLAVLSRLDADGPSSISDLAARERIGMQSIAEIVRDLQIAGLVERRTPAVGRRALIELTPAGLNLLDTTNPQRETWLALALERELDAGERELLREASVLLSRIADASNV